jgi:predicted nucleic acid-binding protein
LRIFLDANVIFSAAITVGAMAAFLLRLEGAGHTFVCSEEVIAEGERNIVLKRSSRMDRLTALTARVENCPRSGDALDIGVRVAAKDVHVLRAAIQSNCDVLLTGDRAHFGELFGQHVQGVLVLTAAMLYERLFS